MRQDWEAHAVIARTWNNKIRHDWRDLIEDSIAASRAYRYFELPQLDYNKQADKQTVVKVVPLSVQDAVREFMKTHKGERLCVLNFADFKKIGGKFLEGAYAQEEALCHNSGLYPILEHFQDEYDYRCERPTYGGLYYENCIYSERVPFASEVGLTKDPYFVDILTYAAPCLIRKGPSEQYYDIMSKRMLNAFLLPAIHGCKNVMLGAWGCGVFNNPPEYVAGVWDYYTKKIGKCFYNEIWHPILPGPNLDVFKSIITEGDIN